MPEVPAPSSAIRSRANRAVQHIIDELVAEGRELGIQVAAYRGAHLIVDAWAGSTGPGGTPVNGETLFNAFSVAKAISATALHLQAERGLVDYDAPVARYWPEFAGEGREKITVNHVLTHRSGLMRMPSDVTPAQMCDWSWMIRALERTKPAFEPGTAGGYQSMTFGWLIGEIVRRTDPAGRALGHFVREEIALPLGAPDLWLGIPDSEQGRVATLDDGDVSVAPAGSPYRETTPSQVDLLSNPFGRPDVRRACIPAVGAIVTARSTARLFAMIANGGALDGTRLLSAERIAMFSEPRPGFDEPDYYFGNRLVPIGRGGYWLGGTEAVSARAPRNPRALCHPGMGGSLAWADPDTQLAVAFCHNRLSDFSATETDSRVRVARAIEAAL